MAIDLARFNATFLAESLSGLDAMEADLLELERGDRDPERLQAIFRVIHSIKGGSGSLGFEAIADFSHHLESLLDGLRTGDIEPNREIIDLLLRAVDAERNLLGELQNGIGVDFAPVEQLKSDIIRAHAGTAQAGETKKVVATAREQQLTTYFIRFKPHRGFFLSGNDPLRILRELASLGEFEPACDIGELPILSEIDPEASYLSWTGRLQTVHSIEAVRDVFAWVTDDCDLSIQAMPELETMPTFTQNDDPGPQAHERRGNDAIAGRRASDRVNVDLASSDPSHTVRAQTLQVGADKVDSLVNLVGELVITQTMLKQSVDKFDMTRLAQLRSTLGILERNTRELQQAVLAIRMLPVSFVFGRFHRMVRDIGMALNKKVELKISGESSELDKSVIEKLFDPLTHLVRNALDHGLETAEERIRAGKPEIGTISLHAQHRGGHIEIEVHDDGRGIDPEKIKIKAREMGLIGANDEPEGQALQQLIFRSGFSTANKVTDLSGRGVGLDVVRENITSLGGRVEVLSSPGLGSTFVIRLPLTLAIVEGMFVQVGADTFVLPLAFITECMQSSEKAVKRISGQGMVVEVRGEYLPVVELRQVCNIANGFDVGHGVFVLMEADSKRVALLVDTLLGQDQVVIKSLESNYRKVDHLAGATILGDGRVALILDANSIVRGQVH
jgi:two-component system, chemotaxis family, sensor kinase CheA